MFERYLTDLATTHFGHIIANLDTSQIKISAWNGAVTLQDVELRKDALDHFWAKDTACSPLQIAYGQVGKFEVRIPWKVLRAQFRSADDSSTTSSSSSSSSKADPSMATSVVLTDVNILLTPRRTTASVNTGESAKPSSEQQSDESATVVGEEQLQREELAKQHRAQAAMDAELLQRVALSSQPLVQEEVTAVQDGWRWKLQEFAKTLLSNLSVTIQNIHIRYEDPGTSLGFQWTVTDDLARDLVRYRPSFAIGVTLREFSIQSSLAKTEEDVLASTSKDEPADGAESRENDETAAVDDNVKYKLAAARQLAAYWDSDIKIMAAEDEGNSTNKYFEDVFALLNHGGLPSSSMSDVLAADGFQSRHSFVLDPFSPSIHLGLATSGALYSTMDASLPPCRFNISRSLLEDVVYLRKSLAVWMHAKKGLLLPDETLRRLTRLRPQESALVDPCGWWKYAYAAVLALRENGARNTELSRGSGDRRSSKVDWLWVSRVLGQRRRYIDLYKQFLYQEDQVIAHTALLAMERMLDVSEIVAFRIATYMTLRDEEDQGSGTIWNLIANVEKAISGSPAVDSGDTATTTSDVKFEDSSEILSRQRRSEMFVEMAVALNREQRNLDLQKSAIGGAVNMRASESSGQSKHDPISWKTSLKCPELSLQVNDVDTDSTSESGLVPVVRLSCAFLQDQDLYHDGSWEMTNRIGSLVVADCTATCNSNSIESVFSPQLREDVIFPNLVGPKGGTWLEDRWQDGTMNFDGRTYLQSVFMRIHRVKKWEGSTSSTCTGSTTTTQIRMLPFEIVYATAPVESLSRILDTASIELADDYHRVASRMSAWRERQQKRLFRALAHKQKEIYVDVDVGAPVLLLPENSRQDSQLLIVDLGRLHFSNDSSDGAAESSGFDDKWRLELASIQVQCSTTGHYRNLLSRNTNNEQQQHRGVTETLNQQLVEPFTLNFDIATKIRGVESTDSDEQTSILVLATLPRLAFNLTSSAVRLLRRLQMQWESRKQELRPFSFRRNQKMQQSRQWSDASGPLPSHGSAIVAGRTVEFKFVAPLLGVKFEHDASEQIQKTSASSTALLFDLVLKGTEGRVLRKTSNQGISTLSCNARIRTLCIVDMYQSAGDEFSLLLSSVSPDLMSGRTDADIRACDTHLSSTDLVTVEYTSVDQVSKFLSERPHEVNPMMSDCADTLNIRFNELYVEWNPETLAMINVAVRMSDESSLYQKSLVNTPLDQDQRSSLDLEKDDEFFDAEEDAFYDAESGNSEDENSCRFVSEIAESERSSLAEVVPTLLPERQLAASEVPYPLSNKLSSPYMLGSPWLGTMANTSPDQSPHVTRSKPLEIVFELAKLRVNFNKEARHRRLITAEMDGTSIRYNTLEAGGSKTVATIGNLTFSDCESARNKTLYREILGLKPEQRSAAGEACSILEMELIMKPRLRQYVSLEGKHDDPAFAVELPVSVDFDQGSVHGFDNFLRARFSPMRFVYLQQIWFEIVDYFFAGVISNEIWGSKTPTGDLDILESETSTVSADKIPFTKFDVTMDSPMILFPVSPCSTDYIRLEASLIAFRNRHSVRPMRHPTLTFLADGGNQQWYNNCTIEMNGVSLHSWSQNNLNRQQNQPTAQLFLCWPIGPSAPVNVPKWKVECEFDALDLVLERSDYALLQHIVQYNIGDDSHHLDEWYALQSLPPHALQRYSEGIMVHFGYDAKDGSPSTFDVSIKVPLISFTLKNDDMQDFANIRCSSVCWKYEKYKDRVSKQKVTCDVEIMSSGIVNPILYSSYQRERRQPETSGHRVSDLTYTTITEPSGNNTKTLTVVDASIRAIYPAWRSFSAFFQGLPQPSYLSPFEAIQVGDRWYRIGDQAPKNTPQAPGPRFGWIPGFNPLILPTNSNNAGLVSPSYEFCFLLIRPCILLESNDASMLVLSIRSVDFNHYGKDSSIRRNIKVRGIEVQTQVTGQEKKSSDFSLIKPWSLEASIKCCNGSRQCMCKSHSVSANFDKLQARAAFSDLTVALDAGLCFLRDIRAFRMSNQANMTLSSPVQSYDSKTSFESVDSIFCQPRHRTFRVEWKGFCLVVADDSGRHFAGEQDLVAIFIEGVNFFREEKLLTEALVTSESGTARPSIEYSMRLTLSAVDVVDCLQSMVSPFRSVLTINSVPQGFNSVKDNPSSSLRESQCERTTVCIEQSGATESPTVAVELWSMVDDCKSYGVDLRSIELQYNPSMVVALQRFLGRLAKEARKKRDSILQKSLEERSTGKNTGSSDPETQSFVIIRGIIDVRHFTLCLNKEHQGRRLLETTVSSSHVDLEWSSSGYSIGGHVGELEAVDPAKKDGSSTGGGVIRSSVGRQDFISFRYKTFSTRRFDVDSSNFAVPAWIQSHMDHDKRIDDFLEISVGTVETIFVLERTAEIIDYLSNGMPGKGMGATSQAAKGFVSDRIQKRSFFNVHIDAPRVAIPRGETVESGLSLRLGDFNLSSWISAIDDRLETSRMLKILLSGVSCNLYRYTSVGRIENCALSEIDISLDMNATASSISTSCRLSDVVVHLSYVDYVTVLSVLRENIGRKLEKKSWDNLEAAWEKEAEVNDDAKREDAPFFSSEVTYSTNARLIRYGQPKNPGSNGSKSICLKLFFGSISIILRRNDNIDSSMAPYDMILARFQGLELAVGRNKDDGDQWLNASLSKIFVFDLGRKGRLSRLLRFQKFGDREVDAPSVILQGYSPPERSTELETNAEFDSQIILKVEKDSSSHVTKVAVIVSCLSSTVSMGPLKEVLQFFACEWPVSNLPTTQPLVSESVNSEDCKDLSEGTRDQQSSPETKMGTREFHIRFVLHYPRLVFIADEYDRNSRALVLRGLSIANACFQPTLVGKGESEEDVSQWRQSSTLTLNADFQNISSYIYSDVSDIVGIQEEHLPMLDVIRLSECASARQNGEHETNASEGIGVPLLLPLTVSVEFEQIETAQAPKERTLAISMDPLSIMLSNEDVQLIKSVVKQWSSGPKSSVEQSGQVQLFDVTFRSQRLGLGLRKESGQIVVDYVRDIDSREPTGIQTGDALHSINGKTITDAADVPLSEMVNRLTSESRPLTLTFSRKLNNQVTELGRFPSDHSTVDKIDVSLSAAVLTLMEKEVPLFKGTISTSKVSFQLSRAEDQNLQLSVSTSIGVEYYNLRIWGWEPFVEPGIIIVSASFQETHQGPKELAIEIGDRDAGLYVNVTDSLGESLSKLLEWREDISEDSDAKDVVLSESYGIVTNPRGVVARKAANAAFRFATRQKNETAKPFVFRNKVGLSVAFAQKKQRVDQIAHFPRQQSLISVGGYVGLEAFDPSEIFVVACEEELQFSVDAIRKGRNIEQAGPIENVPQHFPSMTVAVQECNGVVADPFVDLQVVRPEETLLPLTFSAQHDRDSQMQLVRQKRKWVTWLVEQVDEKTVITLGSSIRVASMISESQVDLGIEVCSRNDSAFDSLNVRPIGTVRIGEPFCLPIWLAMQQNSWRCCIRLSGGYLFTPLFQVSPEGDVTLRDTVSQCVECKSTSDASSAWLAVSRLDEGGIVTVSIDCSVSVRNLLPTDIDWQIGDDSSCFGDIIDGSTTRGERSGDVRLLRSGEQVEVLSKGYQFMKIRVKPMKLTRWSAWSSLALPKKRIAQNDEHSSGTDEQEEAVSLSSVHVKDAFNVPLTIGLRISRRACGLDATIYTDLWCTNCTPLNLVFGCSMTQILESQGERNTDGMRTKEISAAEATLKEISSLFESGEGGTGLKQAQERSRELVSDVVRLAGQVATYITEECFEYLEVEGSIVIRRWWALENPFSPRDSISCIDKDFANFAWVDKAWNVDSTGNTFEGWESSPNLAIFSAQRVFNSAHRYRRRRWTRTRLGLSGESMIGGVNAYCQASPASRQGSRDGRRDQMGIRVAVQVDGGKWSVTSLLPIEGSTYGVIRVAKSRWPEISGQSGVASSAVFELCYAISPLDGDWGLLTRSMLVTSRFLLRNDSVTTAFEIKQAGSNDSTAIEIPPGQSAPFHWGDFRLPQLISVRPSVKTEGGSFYKWSGGFDPLTIGPVPVRIKKVRGLALESVITTDANSELEIQSIKIEVEIRPRSGGTGINLSFQEEDSSGDGSLFRVENWSTFPVWFCQDGNLANPMYDLVDDKEGQEDVLRPNESMVFSLDVPYRQGKYSHRKAESMAVLLRARLALAPMSSRAGIETTKVVSLAAAGERVRLNPSKLSILSPDERMSLQHVRIIGIVNNDGPTRVLTLRLMEFELAARSFVHQFQEAGPPGQRREPPLFAQPIVDGALEAIEIRTKNGIPSEDDAVRGITAIRKQKDTEKDEVQAEILPAERKSDLIISFRAAFSGFVISLVDSAPSEIMVVTLKNMNAIATWDMLRVTDSTVYITVTDLQVDNMVPNAPFPVAVFPYDKTRAIGKNEDDDEVDSSESVAPLLVVGLSFAPKHKSGIVCLKSATIAPRNLAIRVDLAFLVRLQKFALDIKEHFHHSDKDWGAKMEPPDISRRVSELKAAAASGVGRQKIYFGGLTILPCNIKLSVAPARALTPEQAALEGPETAAIHQAVRKGDVLLDRKNVGIFGVKVGSRNRTPLAVVRGMFKSFVVDGLLRLDGATINFSGVSLRNYTSTGPQLTTALSAHYMASLRQNLPSLLGSMAAIGNPLGLVRGLGEGVGDFVLEPVKGFQRSIQEMDASYLVDGVARGTLSLARHTVGGFADSAAMLAETFSKNMTVLTLDRRYAQKRDRGDMLREHDDINVAAGLGSGVHKLLTGFLDGVTGVVKAPIRGAEKRGFEGFAKGVGKGLLGLLVKPIIGISDGFTDVMIGVKGSVDGAGGRGNQLTQVRPRRALYGREKSIRSFHFADAAASALMLRTRLAGEPYLSHVDMDDRVALLSAKRLIILGRRGEELLLLKLKHIESVEVRKIDQADGSSGWGIIVLLNTPRRNGSEVEVISCKEHSHAVQLCAQLESGMRMAATEPS